MNNIHDNQKVELIPMRLVSADQVADIICKYENRNIQKTMIYELGKLNGVLATDDQFLQIIGDDDIYLN